jgi:hypothetical protein
MIGQLLGGSTFIKISAKSVFCAQLAVPHHQFSHKYGFNTTR